MYEKSGGKFKINKGGPPGFRKPGKGFKRWTLRFFALRKTNPELVGGTINPCPCFGQVQEKTGRPFFFVPTGFPATGPAGP